MHGIVVSHRAEADLRSIWRWSREKFGDAQADRYLDELGEGMRRLGADPESGSKRDDLRSGYRALLVRTHVVFYTIAGDEVCVQRVLHGSMDSGRHL